MTAPPPLRRNLDETDWISLAERCEKAEGPDDAIDLDLANLLYASGGVPVDYDPEMYLFRHGGWTSSTDAILALIAEKLPECRGRLEFGARNPDDFCIAYLTPPRGYTLGLFGEARSPALALCVAFCKAMANLRSAPDA